MVAILITPPPGFAPMRIVMAWQPGPVVSDRDAIPPRGGWQRLGAAWYDASAARVRGSPKLHSQVRER